MRLFPKTDGYSFMVTQAVAEKLDQNGRQRMDSRTNEPLWVVEVLALDENDSGARGELLKITLAGQAPKVARMQQVTPVELEALPWAQHDRKTHGVAYRAKELKSVTQSKGTQAVQAA